ncbi:MULTISPECIES: alpha/beta hydrolase [Streptomyces]|uniref:Putative membrane protein n=1 Tax=Streptomyces venezuelae (strain ATCC 10712 / CBS 650.69 / DSM 40230 / JCM 4526 / NBRC 13096 / PD 04745) TaxID=953739 RepID=F2R974_STRVP|nr:alpha/beta hydrolase-fold protein [Streptomyces venezuelae]APE22366.1 esterase [Streptomyces venezuelae]QER99750.1 esterase [Streptomyces venezuelae ATCC 10712]QES06771.1 esterase [Streptomyces venezuelae]QES14484.1 esterase [Streptomyces venezuelae]CCA56534.1 putative membrane protein [Streptomyces venezuelae ATCC 10712]
MGLTSNKVLVVAVALAVLFFIATIWLWPRLARRGWRAVVGRVGLLLVTQLALFAAVGLAANRSFLFYGSWADLFGQEQEMGVVVDHAGGSKDLRVVGTQALDVPGGGRPAVAGQIQKVVVSGERSGIVSPAYVYLPPEYFQERYAKRTFPASVVLTGYPGTAENLIKGLKYPRTAYLQAKEGRMQPMILVMLRPTVAPPRDTECVDVPGGPQTETFFADDLPKAVSESYRVGTKPRNWGFMGNSTGGYCALKIALHHPDRFAAGAGFSAYYRAAEDVTTGDLFHGNDGLRKRGDLLWSLDHRPQGPTSFLVTTSQHGEDNRKDTLAFIKKVKSPAKVSSITLKSGGHNFNTWNREIPPGLVWMGAKLSAT